MDLKDVFAICFIAIGILTAIYVVAKLILWFVRESGHKVGALWIASASCAALGIVIGLMLFSHKSGRLTIMLGLMYFVIRGLWVLLHWTSGTPLDEAIGSASGDSGSVESNDDRNVFNVFGYGYGYGRNVFGYGYGYGVLGNNKEELGIGGQGTGVYAGYIRIDSDLGIDHRGSSISSFDSWH